MKFITYLFSIILFLFLISCQTLKFTQVTKTKVKAGRPNLPSFYEYQVYVTVEKGDIFFTKIIINNTIQKKEFSVKNTQTKKISMNNKIVPAGTYVLSYKIKEDQIKTENDLVEIFFQQNGKKDQIKTTTNLGQEKKLK